MNLKTMNHFARIFEKTNLSERGQVDYFIFLKTFHVIEEPK